MQRLPFTPKDLVPFVEPPMDNTRESEKLARPFYAILSSGSARKGDWARHYRKEAGEKTNHKAIERLMVGLEPELLLRRLIDSETPFVLVDPTEIPRPKAKHTPYVGRLKDGELGFMAFTLAQPYQGRAIPTPRHGVAWGSTPLLPR